MTKIDTTEKDIIDLLVSTAKSAGEAAPRAIVVERTANRNGLLRTVKIALVVSINNETVIDKLISKSLESDLSFEFVGSETNLQSDLEIDYIFFDCDIYAKIGA